MKDVYYFNSESWNLEHEKLLCPFTGWQYYKLSADW